MSNRIIKSQGLNRETTQSLALGSGATHFVVPHNASPVELECKRDGEIIRSVMIRCACGEQVELICEYAD